MSNQTIVCASIHLELLLNIQCPVHNIVQQHRTTTPAGGP